MQKYLKKKIKKEVSRRSFSCVSQSVPQDLQRIRAHGARVIFAKRRTTVLTVANYGRT